MLQIILLFNVFPLSVFSITLCGPPIFFSPHFSILLYFLLQIGTNYFLHQVIGSPKCHTMLSAIPTGILFCRRQNLIHKLFWQEFCSVCPQDSAHPVSAHCLSSCFDLTCSALGLLTNFQAPETPSNELLN